MPRTRQLLCIFYGVISLTALIMTWSQNLLYFQGANPAGFGQYVFDLKVNGAARSFTVDIGLFLLAATGLMAVEARKIGMKFVWLYVIFGFLIGRPSCASCCSTRIVVRSRLTAVRYRNGFD